MKLLQGNAFKILGCRIIRRALFFVHLLLDRHVGRLKSEGLGVVGKNTDVGFYIHPTLIVDGQSGFPLGLSTIQMWSRDFDHPNKYERNYQKLPIEEKESYKWLASCYKKSKRLKSRWSENGHSYWRSREASAAAPRKRSI